MGELLAILTAVLWAIGVIFFKRSVSVVGPFALNLLKNCIAFVLLALTALAFQRSLTFSIPPRDLLVMLLSGAVGIGISDTLFLMTLARMGASRTALIDCMYSPFVILFSFIAFKETLTPVVVIGGCLILGSVLFGSQRKFGVNISQTQFLAGRFTGAAAMATVALAIILVKPLLNTYPLMVLSTVRMAGGIAILIPMLALHPDRKSVRKAARPQQAWRWIFWGTFFGSYLSLICWL